MKKIRILTVLLALLTVCQSASAQIDAIIDAVVGAVEPTPVYDTGLREATENLASKIDRLNNVLFGGSEQTSAVYRYKTMYSDLYDLTTTFSSFVDRSYSNARRLEALYTDMDGGSLSQNASKVHETWYIYDNTVRNASRVIAQFKKLFSDSNTTNAEVRQASRAAITELKVEMAREDRRVREEIEAAQIAAGLTQCADFMTPSREEYVERGKSTYGTTINSGGSSASVGTFGQVIMVLLGLMSVVYTAFAGFHIFKGSKQAETQIARLIILYVFTLIVILSIQSYI